MPLGVLIFNFIPDYILIIETRLILTFLRKSRRKYIFIMTDGVITFLIPYITLYIAIKTSDDPHYNVADEYIKIILLNHPISNTVAIFIYSTFLTSLWIWLYAIGNMLMSAGRRSNNFRRFLDRHLLLEEKPLGVMGWLFIATMTVIFGGYVGVARLTT